MISKWKINLIAFLISMTLFSVGFSSWQITSKFVEIANGTIDTDKLDTYYVGAPNEELLSFIDAYSPTGNTLQIFDFDENGFYDEKGKSTITAMVSADIFVNLCYPYYDSRWQDYYPSADSLNFEFTLSAFNTTTTGGTTTATPVDIFQYCTTLSPAASIIYFGDEAGVEHAIENPTDIRYSAYASDGGNYSFSIKLANVLSNTYKIQSLTPEYLILRAKFKFEISKADPALYDNFYKAISDKNFQFGVSALAAGYNS